MKRCPKCNRTYTTQTQRFCTHDGQPLVNSEAAGADTVRIDPVFEAPEPARVLVRVSRSSRVRGPRGIRIRSVRR